MIYINLCLFYSNIYRTIFRNVCILLILNSLLFFKRICHFIQLQLIMIISSKKRYLFQCPLIHVIVQLLYLHALLSKTFMLKWWSKVHTASLNSVHVHVCFILIHRQFFFYFLTLKYMYNMHLIQHYCMLHVLDGLEFFNLLNLINE